MIVIEAIAAALRDGDARITELVLCALRAGQCLTISRASVTLVLTPNDLAAAYFQAFPLVKESRP